jgi:hypothetical protein
MIKNARDIVGKFKLKHYTVMENVPGDIRGLNISEKLKQEMAIGFNSSMVESRRQMDTLWYLEEKTVSEVENIFALLSAKGNAWLIQEGQILFTSATDLNLFNSYLDTIDELVREQSAIQKVAAETAIKRLERLKD